MREYTKKPENQSRTLDSNPRASRQAPISEILQAYKNGTLGRQPIQREGVEDEYLLQTKSLGQAPTNVILQRYRETTQRYAPEEDEELLQGKFDNAQREKIDEDELLQGKFDLTSTIGQEFVQREEKTNNTGLPDNLKTGIENISGYSMDDVKVHYNSDKPAQLQALAYAQGTDIHVATGQEIHLPHEAWHVVQQKQGRVQPTMQLQDLNVNDNERLEKEADAMGVKATQQVYPYKNSLISKNNIQESIQRTPAEWAIAPQITRMLGHPHGWFSTWKKIKTQIREYTALVPVNLDERRSKLDETRPLIVEWEADPKHTAASTEQRVRDIRADMPILQNLIEREYTQIAVDTDAITGGHAEVRHGADLTDQQLQNRITTGYDRTGAPAATNTSSRFKSHDLLVQTRVDAVNQLNEARNDTLAHFIPLLNNCLIAWRTALSTAQGQQRGAAFGLFNNARTAVQNAVGVIVAPHPNMLPVNYHAPVTAGAALANIANRVQNMITVKPQYTIVINTGSDLGSSFYDLGAGAGIEKATNPPRLTLSVLNTTPNPATLFNINQAAQWGHITHYPTTGTPTGIS